MTPTLTKEQIDAIAANPRSPTRLIDPGSNREFVLLPAEQYERIMGMIEDEFDPREAYAAIDRAFAEGWSDPKLDDYERYDELKR